jgi:hypothetical protein
MLDWRRPKASVLPSFSAQSSLLFPDVLCRWNLILQNYILHFFSTTFPSILSFLRTILKSFTVELNDVIFKPLCISAY